MTIKRPKHLSRSSSLGEDAFRHGYYKIKKILEKQNKSIELMVLLFANVATINNELINKGIEFLRLMDGVALAMPIGLGLVRVGNFLNGQAREIQRRKKLQNPKKFL